MHSSYFNTILQFAVIGVILLPAILGAIYRGYRRKNSVVNLASTPVLLAYYTDDTNIMPVEEGMFGDLHYEAMVAVNYLQTLGNAEAALLYRVELPFSTAVHLLGIPKKTGAVQLNPAEGDSIMERVELEGDYNDYFSLFCEKGMQETARYVLDPNAMLFTFDFCQSQNWEIVGNELYFVMASGMKQDPVDSTNLEQDIMQFVSEIRPAVARQLNDEEKAALTPYGEDRRTDLKCPICSKVLINNGQYFSCPGGDGTLLTGAELLKVKKGILTVNVPANKTVHTHAGDLTCPSCGRAMTQVPYDGGSTIIDSCTYCPYRWLDAGEESP